LPKELVNDEKLSPRVLGPLGGVPNNALLPPKKTYSRDYLDKDKISTKKEVKINKKGGREEKKEASIQKKVQDNTIKEYGF
jgi:hypothetical protein